MAINWTTTLDIALGTDDTNAEDFSFRVVIPKTVLEEQASIPMGATHIRVTYPAAAALALYIPNAFVGHRAGSGDAYDASSLTRITFNGGSNDVAISAGASAVSDAIPFTYDGTSDLVFTFYIPDDALNNGTRKQSSVTGVNTYLNDPTDESGVANATPGYATSSNSLWGITKVEFGVQETVENPCNVAKLAGYAVLTPMPIANTAKLTGYAVLAPAPTAKAAKLTGYAVLQPTDTPEGNTTYQYSYMPVVN